MHAWQNFLTDLRPELGDEAIDKWLTPLQVDHFDACNLYLKAQDAFQAAWFEEHIRPRLKKRLANNNNHPIKVHLSIEKKIEDLPENPETLLKPKESLCFLPDTLDPGSTFENFLCTQTNQITFQLLSELAGYDSETKTFKEPTLALGTFNPIYIHGASATGKTHLLMAITSSLQHTGLKVLYVRAETFTEHVVRAIRSSAMLEFRKTYRHVDVLLIDDIQILARRGATQEELFHTFNTLHTLGKQIIISSSCPAGLLPAIEPRLVSRFEWGLTLHLEKLSIEELRQLLDQRCEALDFPLSSEIIHYLLKHFGETPRSLLRSLESLILYVHMRHHRSSFLLSLDDAQEALKSLLEEEKRGMIDPQKIIRAVADHFGISAEEILGKSQTQGCVMPRQIAMHLCREILKMPYLRIGETFHRDHSTVMSSVRIVQKKLETQDRELATALSLIQQKITMQN
ncbi:MAG: chromosomal replication initiator protein DnaA [Simkania sp.]|nr:chromosomal replication initiator protein DnaA [Simkania sp.]